ncbi:hypothetical protein [Ammonifex thiophilus]|uniref:Uncharacterized protein n=1 Tax=Ammonifex thiophilus TaxID=444093 RepID=A0A3D8P2H2_9THEO|nr:hypothetical protein [Ammonifex thiophilus]RDV81183.1 hypothetical protein DXX99_09840 [Ammonifex thiophilus]
MKRLFENLKARACLLAAKRLLAEEKGSLDQLVWVIGAAVVVVLVVVAFMILAPQTAQQVWQKFINWATGKFGM